jgi:hypothetical protein
LVSAFVNAENGLADNAASGQAGDGMSPSLAGSQGLVGNDGQGLRNHSDRLLSAVVNRANSGGFKGLFYQKDSVALWLSAKDRRKHTWTVMRPQRVPNYK